METPKIINAIDFILAEISSWKFLAAQKHLLNLRKDLLEEPDNTKELPHA